MMGSSSFRVRVTSRPSLRVSGQLSGSVHVCDTETRSAELEVVDV